MKNFKVIELEKLKDNTNYAHIEEGIYNDLKDEGGYATHRIALSIELEDEEDSQYPLEDILNKFYVHVEEFLESDDPIRPKYLLGGELDDVKKIKSLIGKRAYNQNFVDDEGVTRVDLIIE